MVEAIANSERETTLAALVAALREPLALRVVAGNLERAIRASEAHIWPAELIGYLNPIHPERLQVVGAAELAWAERQRPERTAAIVREIVAAKPPAIIVADDIPPPPIIVTHCQQQGIALLCSPHPAAEVIDRFRLKIARLLAERTIVHGVLMDVLGVGVLITGEAGTGKSELALELVTRGHGLVADDAVEIARISPVELEGRCPPLLQNYLEVRGLGLLDVRTIFGETAVRRKIRLRLITYLKRLTRDAVPLPRLQIEEERQEILGVAIPRVTLPVAPGRNMAVLLEAAVRHFILKLRGIDTTQAFIDRHQALLAAQQLSEPTADSSGETLL